MVNLRADKLVGTQIFFDKNTVGATINAIMASVKADGLTIIENAAKDLTLSTSPTASTAWARISSAQAPTLSRYAA